MKKSNFQVLVIFAVLIAISAGMIACNHMGAGSNTTSANHGQPPAPETTMDTAVTEGTAPAATDADVQGTVPAETQAKPEKPSDNDSGETTMQDALFVGDSRTVGLWDYACFEGADYFADIGMTVYNIDELTLSVPSVGRVGFEELLENKQYGKIYLMLGINEAGYDVDQTTEHYRQLVDQIKKQQPDAEIFLQANLHVSKHRSDGDSVINNPTINRINQAIEKIAKDTQTFYLDANPVFDDETGSLSADLTGDETHLYGKYYARWADWIVQQTGVLEGET